MTETLCMLARTFPTPPGIVCSALDELRLAASLPPESESEWRRVATLPRPWDPPSCPPELRRNVYQWLDNVAGWINEEHAWRVDRMIPICWDLHPHIVHQLATVACLRREAEFALTPQPLEDWHRATLPAFLDRIAQRIGATGCPPGRHQANPGDGRNALYRDVEEADRRRKRRWNDMEHQPARLDSEDLPDRAVVTG